MTRAFDDLVAWVKNGTKPQGDDVDGDLTNAGHDVHEPAAAERSGRPNGDRDRRQAVKRALAAAAAACVALASGRAQEPARIDFVRDVQPIFRQHCYGCHGPSAHQAGLRLDRRADAMRGGTIAVIGPGTSQGSRLYLRVAGQRGSRMPPTATLTDAQIETIKTCDRSGRGVAGRSGGRRPAAADAAADARRARPRPRRGAASPRRRRERERRRNASNATALMWAVDDEPMTRLLVDRGADVNAASDDGRTPLMIASGLRGNASIVRLLLERRASVTAEANGAPPLIDAAYTGDEANLRLLLDAGAPTEKLGASRSRSRCSATAARARTGRREAHSRNARERRVHPAAAGGRRVAGPVPPRAARRARRDRARAQAHGGRAVEGRRRGHRRAERVAPADSPRAAVIRSLPLLQGNDVSLSEEVGLRLLSPQLGGRDGRRRGARVRGLRSTKRSRAARRRRSADISRAGGSTILVGAGRCGESRHRSAIFCLGLAAEELSARRKHGRDGAVPAGGVQDANGQWHIIAHRPPIESNDIEVTAACMRALQLYAPARGGERYTVAIDRAARWLGRGAAEDDRRARVSAARPAMERRGGGGDCGWRAPGSPPSSDPTEAGRSCRRSRATRTRQGKRSSRWRRAASARPRASTRAGCSSCCARSWPTARGS